MPLYQELPAPARLSRWVECAWSLQTDTAGSAHRVPPDGCVDIVYDSSTGIRAVGAMTVEQRFSFPQGASLAGIRFRPGMARAFLGISPAELTDGSTPLDDLWSAPARELRRKLDDARSIRDAMGILLGNLSRPDAAPDPVQRAIEALTGANGSTDLTRAAADAGLSSRQFRRRCLEETGLTPKHLCRVLRFRYACRMAEAAARPNWSAIAAEAAYFDQAHLIHDFQEFTGFTPMAVFSNTSAMRAR